MKALLWALALLLPVPVEAAGSATNRVIVRYKNRAPARAMTVSSVRVNSLGGAGSVTLTPMREMSGGKHVLALPGYVTEEEAEALAARLRQDPDVEFAVPDRRYRRALAPNDPFFGNQWHYTSSATNVGGANLPGAWNISTGSRSVIVAVVDSGITAHPDLDNQRVAGYDMIAADPSGCSYSFCTANDGNGRDSDPSDPGDWLTAGEIASEGTFSTCDVQNNSSWHGTHVAGTVGASGNDGIGVAGVAFGVKIQPVRVLGKCGGWGSDIADGIVWAAGGSVSGVPANATPAKVINLSLSGPGACDSLYQDAIDYAVGQGAVVVVAAGNDNDDATSYSPGNCSNTVTVAAVSRAGAKAYYSNTGSNVDIAAPGGDTSGASANGVLSTFNTGATSPGSGTTTYLQGTSMAAPHVSGVAALMLSVEPSLTPAEVLTKLRANVRSFPGSSGCTTSTCGAGLLDAEKALLGTIVKSTVTGVTATTLGVSSVSYSWSVLGTAQSYKLYNDSGGALIASPTASPHVVTGIGPNTPFTVRISAVRLTIEGAYTVSPTTYTLGSPVTGAAGAAHLSSVTVSWTPCPVGECAGYSVDLSTMADMTGTLLNSKTSDRSVSQLQIAGLLTGTSYWARISSLNDLGGLNSVQIGPLLTRTFMSAPAAIAATGHGPSSMTITWADPGNPFGTTYEASLSSVSDHATGVSRISDLSGFAATFSGLQANTTYYPRVRTIGGPTGSGAETYTRPADPSSVAAGSAGTTFVTLSWSRNGNAPAPHTAYLAELASDAAFSSVVASSVTRSLSADFTGLSTNTTYYGRVRVVPGSGSPNAFVAAAGLSTLALQPVGVSVTGASGPGELQVTFVSGGNGAGVRYRVEVATTGLFTAVVTSQTLNLSAAFSGLQPATTYFARVVALNHAGALSAYSGTSSGAVFPDMPGLADVRKPTASISGLTAQWTAGGNGPAFPDRAELHDSASFDGVFQTSITYSTSAVFTGLQSNTTYYLRVKRLSVAPVSDSAFRDMGGLSTLALPPSAPAAPFHPVSYTSAVVSWVARPAAPISASARGYRVEFATSSTFSGIILSSTVYGSATSTAGVTGLSVNTTYWVRVGALNHQDDPNWVVLGSTRTLMPLLSSGVYQGAPLLLSVIPAFNEFDSVQVEVPVGAFPAGTAVTLNTSVAGTLPDPGTNQGLAAALAPGVGVTIEAGGLQPARNIVVRMVYDPATLNPALEPKKMRLFRYDETARLWTLLPSVVDTNARTLTAVTNHFSFFAPFIVSAGTSIDNVKVFPIPWAPGTSQREFNAPALTFSNLPVGAEIRLMSLSGELLWSNIAEVSGVVTWNGITRHGRRAGSGTYLAVIEKDGSRLVKRVVVVR